MKTNKDPKKPSKQHQEAFKQLLCDPNRMIRMLKVRAKGSDGRPGRIVDFVPTSEQQAVIDAWVLGTGQLRADLLAAKSRQIGFTTVIVALFFIEWLGTEDPMLFVHLAHKDSVAKEILAMHRIFIDSLPAAFRPELASDSKTELKRKNGATIMAGTARGDGGLRSLTVHRLHISEYAFCPDAKELRASSFSAVPDAPIGRKVLESTANFVNDPLHQEFQTSEENDATTSFTRLFFPWFEHYEYRTEIDHDFVRTEEEEALAEESGLCDEQLYWRRRQVTKLGIEKFKREYPKSLDEAYSSGEGRWLSDSDIADVSPLDIEETGLTVFEPPDRDDAYVLAIDCSAGVGADAHAAVMLSVKHKRTVAAMREKSEAPYSFGERCALLAKRYNALVAFERNFWSSKLEEALRDNGARLFFELRGDERAEDPGFITSERSKQEILENLRSSILDRSVYKIDRITRDELRTAKVKDGRIVFPRTAQGHGDMAMATAIALHVAKTAAVPKRRSVMDDFISKQRVSKIINSTMPGGQR